MISEKGNMFHP